MWQQLGMQAASNVVNAGMGMILGSINDRRQVRQQGRLTEQQLAAQKRLMEFQQKMQLEMWEKTGYGAQMEQMKKAGLNPGLMYGMGGGGGQSIGGGVPTAGGGHAPAGGGEAMGLMGASIAGLQQAALLKAQKENIEADTQNKLADAANKPKQGLNIDADTENKALQSVILKYAGKEAADVYQYKSKESNRLEEEARWFSENTAARAIAQNIYDLWANGKLQDKSLAEIEAITLSNSKSREETKNIQKQFDIMEENLKGAKLDNIMKELEAKLQTQTGLDRNAPAWLKVIGRLLIGLGLIK